MITKPRVQAGKRSEPARQTELHRRQQASLANAIATVDQHDRAVHRDCNRASEAAEVGRRDRRDSGRHALFSLAWTAAASIVEYSPLLTAPFPCNAISISFLMASSRLFAEPCMR